MVPVPLTTKPQKISNHYRIIKMMQLNISVNYIFIATYRHRDRPYSLQIIQ